MHVGIKKRGKGKSLKSIVVMSYRVDAAQAERLGQLLELGAGELHGDLVVADGRLDGGGGGEGELTLRVLARRADLALRLVVARVHLLQGGHQPKISGGPRFRQGGKRWPTLKISMRWKNEVENFEQVEKRWSTLKRWSIRGGKKVARRGHRWSQTGTAVSDGHPDLLCSFAPPPAPNASYYRADLACTALGD